MTFVARLTWQARDPAALATDLERRLGVVATPGRGVPGAFTIALGTANLEILPWQRETSTDEPREAGRLVFEPAPDGDDPPPAGTEPARVVLVGVGWATVEICRAEAELDPWLEPRAVPGDAPDGELAGTWAGEVDADEPHLGARARRRGAGRLPAGSIVLLEPTTEGRLAASLARDGEGPCVLYLEPREGLAAWRRAARARGIATAAVRPGPLGASSLLFGGAVAGPHLVVVDRPAHSSSAASPGTIAS
jgi:hypothetical protein